MGKSPSFLTVDWVLSQFGQRRSKAQEKYRAFVKEGIGKPGPWNDLRRQILLGNNEFVSEIESFLKLAKEVKEVPRR